MKVAGCELNAYEPHAAMDVRRWFDLNPQMEEYLGWYEEILEVWHRGGLLAHCEVIVVKLVGS